MIESFSDHIARSERKLVVTITSGMASLADNTSVGSIAYRSSKAAVNMVMRSAAIDLAPRGIVALSKRADSERIFQVEERRARVVLPLEGYTLVRQ